MSINDISISPTISVHIESLQICTSYTSDPVIDIMYMYINPHTHINIYTYMRGSSLRLASPLADSRISKSAHRQ